MFYTCKGTCTRKAVLVKYLKIILQVIKQLLSIYVPGNSNFILESKLNTISFHCFICFNLNAYTNSAFKITVSPLQY